MLAFSEEESRRPGQRPTTAMLGNEVLTKEQLYDLFQQILGVKKFEHQLLYNAMQVWPTSNSMSWTTTMIFHLQLENSDEQAAAIRRELDARQEKLQEMQRVCNSLFSPSQSVSRNTLFSEQKIDAQICLERNGVTLRRRNDPANQQPEIQLGVLACPEDQ